MSNNSLFGTGFIFLALIIEVTSVFILDIQIDLLSGIFLIGITGFFCGLLIGDNMRKSLIYYDIIGVFVLTLAGMVNIIFLTDQFELSLLSIFNNTITIYAISIAGLLVIGSSVIDLYAFGEIGKFFKRNLIKSPDILEF